jgi:UDP-glucose:(heptosyl)LPS alpha-1,3-glucosyltransferase
MPQFKGPRFLRPWLFGRACLDAMARSEHDVTVGFDKTWGQDVLYPQGGLHVASAEHNLQKHRTAAARLFASVAKRVDPAANAFRLLERRQYCDARMPVIIANSRMVREHFRIAYGIAHDKVHIVPNAIHPSRFESSQRSQIRDDWRKKWSISDGDPVALFVAMNYRLKGLEPLLHAMRRVPESSSLRLLVVGNPLTRSFERLAQRLRVADRVVFHGFCADSRQAYFASDFLVHPTFYDPCSLVVLEALACGLPVVTSQYNGAAELLEPAECGRVIDDPHDAERLAECLMYFADSKNRLIASDAARVAASRWTFDDHYRKIVDVLRIAAQRRAATS